MKREEYRAKKECDILRISHSRTISMHTKTKFVALSVVDSLLCRKWKDTRKMPAIYICAAVERELGRMRGVKKMLSVLRKP